MTVSPCSVFRNTGGQKSIEDAMTESSTISHMGVMLNVDWRPGAGVLARDLPAVPGIYAQIYWPENGVRIGETGRSIRGKIRHDIHWFESMKNRTAPEAQLRRTLPIAMAAKATGAAGFEYYVVSIDQRLADKDLRQACERHLFAYVRNSAGLVDWNRQWSWR